MNITLSDLVIEILQANFLVVICKKFLIFKQNP